MVKILGYNVLNPFKSEKSFKERENDLANESMDLIKKEFPHQAANFKKKDISDATNLDPSIILKDNQLNEDHKENDKTKLNVFEKISKYFKNKKDFYKEGLKNTPNYTKEYFTKTVPGYFKDNENAYKHKETGNWGKVNAFFGKANNYVKGVGNIVKDFTVAGAKAILAIASCVPGPSAIAAGAINGARIGYSIAENYEKEAKGKTSFPKLKKFIGVVVGAVAGGFIGAAAPGVMGVAGAAYDTKRLIEKSGDHYKISQEIDKSNMPLTTEREYKIKPGQMKTRVAQQTPGQEQSQQKSSERG